VISAEGSTVGEVLEAAGARHPELLEAIIVDGSMHRFINVYVDDDDVRYIGGLDAAVEDGQVISLLPAVAGGAQ
jgi:molybdopterin converting factor small subunit